MFNLHPLHTSAKRLGFATSQGAPTALPGSQDHVKHLCSRYAACTTMGMAEVVSTVILTGGRE